MNGEQRYNEALERARKEYKTHESFNGFRVMLLHIFPELEVSDDEKVRKELIDAIRDLWHLPTPLSLKRKNAWLAWLEKQGEQKSQGKSALEVWKDMRLEVYQQASGNRHEYNYSDDKTKMFSLSDIDEIIEKINEEQV